MKIRKSAKYQQESTKFYGKARGGHINMPGIDAIIGGSRGAAIRIVSERKLLWTTKARPALYAGEINIVT